MSSTSKKVDDQLPNGFFFLLRYLPKRVRVPIVFLFWILLLVTIFLAAAANAKVVFPPKDATQKCNKNGLSFVSSFEENVGCAWSGMNNLTFSDTGKSIVSPKITENFLGGRDIFFDIPTSPDFQAIFRFVPLHPEKINVAFNYGYMWRIIIGNGDYNQVVMQRNSQYPKRKLGKSDWVEVPENNEKKWIKRKGRLEPGKEVTVTIVSRSKPGTSIIHISIFIQDLEEEKEFNFDYDVAASKSAETIQEVTGIGLLDPFNEGIETQLVDFKLQKNYDPTK